MIHKPNCYSVRKNWRAKRSEGAAGGRAALSAVVFDIGEGNARYTNLDLPAIALRFDDARLRDAIRDYYRRSSQDTIDLIDKLARHSPDNAVTNDGFDDRGPRYRIAPDITNGQIAVFAACAFAGAQSPISSAIELMDDIAGLYSYVTI